MELMESRRTTVSRGQPPLETLKLAPTTRAQAKASDEGEQGPSRSGLVVRTIDDDRGDTAEQYTIELPFEQQLCKICLNTGKGNYLALTLENILSHTKEHQVQPKFKCSRCGKEYLKKHAAQCHMPKCSGPVSPKVLDYVCESCGDTFKTKSGLSQHLRHRHPIASNEARAAGTSQGEQAPKDGKTFKKEEIQRMLDLEVEFHGDRMIARRMADFIPTKTVKQLRDKRNEAAYKRMRDNYILQHPHRPEELIERGLDETVAGELTVGSPAAQIDTGLVPPASHEEEILDTEATACVTPEVPQSPVPMLRASSLGTGVDPTPPPASPEVTQWREGIIETALAEQLPDERLIPAGGAAAPVQLLRQKLAEVLTSSSGVPQLELDEIYGKVAEYLLKGSKEKEAPSSERTEERRGRKGHNRSRRKRQYIYARSQELYEKNPGLLAKYVRENVAWHEDTSTKLGASDVREIYQKLWGTKYSGRLPDLGEPEQAKQLKEVLTPITTKEVRKRLARTKNDTAVGPDGIKKSHLLHGGNIEILRLLFSLVLVSGKQPTPWRTNRTTLIRKDGTDPTKATNYRPITIGSLLSRLYWGVIDQKIRSSVVLTPRQKGFTAENGCYNNVHILNEVLRHSKTHNGLVVVQLDVSKAFDTIPHEIIGAALRRKGLPEYLIEHVEDSYKGVCTEINCGHERVNMELQRGVKQGDPLSPFIFNVVIEPLLLALESRQGYTVDNNIAVSSLAFADDMLLLSNEATQASDLLEVAETYLKQLGMSISVGKCATFQIKTRKDSWYLADPCLKLLSGERIPYADAGAKLNYLGMAISPWAGIDLEGLKDNLCEALGRVKKLALRPYQKVDLISTYLVPHYLYQLATSIAPITMIRALDQELRVVVKDIYHLPQSTANGLIYSGKRDGGLGFPKLEVSVVASSLKTGLKFMHGPDPVMQALALGTGMVNRLKNLANAVRINWPVVDAEEINRYKMRAKKEELASWASLSTQGKSVRSLTDDKIANAWLYKPKLLKPCRFITALKMRTNTTANKVVLHRAKAAVDTNCRKCKSKPETLAHILGQCTTNKAERIRRHDEIKDLVMDKIMKRDKEAVVTKEVTLSAPSGENLKPDLIVKNQKGVFVVDITVRHEDNEYLAQGRQDKIQKYSRLLPLLRRKYGATAAEVLPIVVGTRGAMPRETIGSLRKLSITDRKTLITISLIALRSSIEIYHRFMDYDGPRTPGET